MLATGPSPFAWPILVGLTSTFVPLVAAAVTRRSPRDDAGAQVAVGWAVLGVLNLVALAQFLQVVPRSLPVVSLSAPLSLLCFTPPLLSWVGRGSARHRWWIAIVATAVMCAAGMAVLGVDREFRLVTVPAVGAVLTVLSVTALATMLWRRAGQPWRADWFWVLLGMTVYFVVGIVWKPLTEFLVARSWAALVDLHMGMMLLHGGTYCLMAWGLLRPRTPRAQSRQFQPAPEAA